MAVANRFLVAVMLGSLAAVGCSAENPNLSEPTVPGPDSSKPDDPVGKPFVSIPSFTPLTKWHSVPIVGVGTPGATLVYESPAGGLRTAAIGSSGDFCIDIPLQASAAGTAEADNETEVPNEIFLHTVLGNQESNRVSIVVTQKGTPPTPSDTLGPDPSSHNVAEGTSVIIPSNIEVRGNGDGANVTDGAFDAGVEYQYKSAFDFGSIRPQLVIKLPGAGAQIYSGRVTTNDGCTANHSLYFSENDDVNYIEGGLGGSDGWTFMPNSSTDGTVRNFVPEGFRPHAKWVSVVLWPGTCSGFSHIYPITELEIFGLALDSDDSSEPVEVAPSCQSL